MDPILLLQLHNDRLEASLRRHRLQGARPPRPPGARRANAAQRLRRLADRLESPAAAHHARHA